MAVAIPRASSKLLTYEDYLAEGEVMARYEIVDGVRNWMTSPNRVHQEITGILFEKLRTYQRATRRGRTLFAPCDILISRRPLRTRQPDVLFISNEQLAKCPPPTDPSPLTAAPELVVEVLSPSDTRRVRDAKIADYCAVGVRECWIVSPEAETVEVLRLTADGPERVAIYGYGQTLASITFDDLTIALADIFRTEDDEE